MEWMTGDEEFNAKWKALMLACVKNGTKIQIIHNIERGTDEMLDAISNWLPLYMSGLIESFVCHKKSDMRFSHTMFLCPDAACVFGAHVRGAEKEGWYDYISVQDKLSICKAQYDGLLSQAEPLIRLFFEGDNFRIFDRAIAASGCYTSLLPTLSYETMPKELLLKMLNRSGIADNMKRKIIAVYEEKRQDFLKILQTNEVSEFFPLASDEQLFGGYATVNLPRLLCDTNIYYTPEEYAEHVSEIIRLYNEYPSFNLYVLPENPFSGIQIRHNDSYVAVVKDKKPYVVFAFTNPYMLRAFGEYFAALKRKYKLDRNEIRQMLKQYL